MQQVLDRLSDHLETIYFCIIKGFNKASAFLDTSATPLDKTARANVIRGYVVNEIKATFSKELCFHNQNRLLAFRNCSIEQL